jgi:LPS-assembly lipoprotein
MSLFNRRIFLLSAAALAGCGFTPAYKAGGSAAALRGQISIAAGDDRESYALAKDLTRIFTQSAAPRYHLDYTITTGEDTVGITQDQEITRYHVTGEVTFTLTDLNAGQIAASGTVSSFTAYSATGTTVATLSATNDAYARLMSILASKISTEIQAKAGPSS